ncbi:hypothetical protein ISF_00470 [Cordyceps fumosorosea ARSEF 2679]|uniref:Transmembrane protein n=1 Tax=Cordyceps fumosorosea (strain ARSEF 2679) TaxID=1081104 RepID=A0A162N0H1_CORFA|nr:hypothetical protein ISF_00470 [Cordyceps fumosorosea ARSEF 2679]OAA73569.1 hypothetical protein ISF_00470 [Cordyceps fumosorosea ARSEF 2679]
MGNRAMQPHVQSNTEFDSLDRCERGVDADNDDPDATETPPAVLAFLGLLMLILGLHQCLYLYVSIPPVRGCPRKLFARTDVIFNRSPCYGATAALAVIMLLVAAVRACRTSAAAGLFCLMCGGGLLVPVGLLALGLAAWRARRLSAEFKRD